MIEYDTIEKEFNDFFSISIMLYFQPSKMKQVIDRRKARHIKESHDIVGKNTLKTNFFGYYAAGD